MLEILAQAPSDTFFTQSPNWGWVIVLYFFLGGIAGGAAFLAGMLDLFGVAADRSMARVGYFIALIAIAISGPLLIVDLNRPDRFWHMLIQSETGAPMFKWYSPISIGIWIVSLFALFVFLASLGALAEMGKIPEASVALARGSLGKLIAAVCLILGLLLAGYTGAVLAATNRPLWADSPWIGLLFLLSGISAGAAAMLVIGWQRTNAGSVAWIDQMDVWAIVLELIVLIVIAATLGSLLGPLWAGVWGIVLVVGVVVIGALIPLLIYARPRLAGRWSIPTAAALVLIGSFLLRAVVVLSSERI
jgi:formate-dependent nitrite reductase membrane component NrfD